MSTFTDTTTAPEPAVVTEPFDYESIPPGYYDAVFQRREGIQSKWHHLKFERVLRELSGHRRVLDVGCGPGTMLGLMGGEHEAVGLDLSTRQIEYARATYAAPGREFHALPPSALPGEVEPFDAVTLVELIEHLEPNVVDTTIREALARLRPGGTLIITTPNFHSAWPAIEAVVNRFGEVKYDFQHINKFTPLRLTRLLADFGLRNVRVEPYLFLAPFAAALDWRLADRVAKYERGAVERRLGMLLLGTATKPL